MPNTENQTPAENGDRKVNRLPKFVIYKGSGALQLELQPADLETNRAGCVMLTICPSTGQKDSRGNPTYNWNDDKIILKLNGKDITDCIFGLNGHKVGTPQGETLVSIVHDPKAGTEEAKQTIKRLSFAPGKVDGMIFVQANFGEKKAYVALDPGERFRAKTLLTAAISRIYGWN
jgi:hypothetical protein